MTSLDDLLKTFNISPEPEQEKTAAEAEAAGGETETTDADLAPALEAAAEEVADADLEKQASIKLAAEYDAAGRIMARAFYDELTKIGASLEQTHAAPNELEPASGSHQEAVGPRGTSYQLKVNNAGSPGHDQPIGTAGSRQVNKDALKDKGAKSTTVGSGVTEQASATPMFATVKNLMG